MTHRFPSLPAPGRMRFLRLLGWIGLVTLAAGSSPGLAQDVFEPYFVYVDQEGVTARCGPGGEYYRTDPLRHGQRLEVYLESEDGWLGVRPPEGSFCWVTAESIELDRGGSTGRVIEDNSLAWIGTHLGKARKYLWQVQMPRGEEVTILGRAEREGAEGPQLWYRIVPPSGEFRWVHRDQVVDSPELLLRDKPRPDQQLAQGSPTPVDDAEALRDRAKPHKRAAESVLNAAPLANHRDTAGPIAEPEGEVRLHALNAPEAIPLVVSALPRDLPATTATRSGDAPQAGQEAPAAGAGALAAAGATADLLSAAPIGSGIAASSEVAAGSAPLLASQSQGPSQGSVQPIGAVVDQSATVQASDGNRSSDDNWVRGSLRTGRAGGAVTGGSPSAALAGTPSSAQLSTQLPTQFPAGVGPAAQGIAGGQATHVSPENLPSVDALQLQLTRHMAATARAADLEPLRLAAEAIAVGHTSPAERQRGRLLAERVQQVQSVARRRDGEREPAAPLVGAPAASGAVAGGGAMLGGALPGREAAEPQAVNAAAGASEVRGYLVQVYSARPDSPPFALTDAAGRTTHYVSPSPGINLRRFLNQHITLSGQTGYETGLDTPHLIVSHAVASPELR